MSSTLVYISSIVGVVFIITSLLSLHLYTGFPFLFIVGFVLAIYLPPKRALVVNASIGLLSDIFLGSLYGFHMIFYVLASFILILYRRKFSSQTARYILFFIVPLLFIYQKVFGSTTSWSIFLGILGGLFFLQRTYKKRTSDYHARLRL